MAETESEKLMKKAKLKVLWQISFLYTKPIPFLEKQVKRIHSVINHITREMAVLQRFIEDNQLEISMESSRSSTECSSSETSQSPSLDTPVGITAQMMMTTTTKRSKRGELSLELKYHMTKNYLRWLSIDVVKKKRQAAAYIKDLFASIENQDLTLMTVQNDIKWLLSKIRPAVCFTNKKSEEAMSTEKWWTIVCVNNKNRDRLIRSTKLENIFLMQEIKKLDMIRKYEEQVNPVEFYRKVLANRTFPKEIAHLTNKRVALLRQTGVAECEGYNLRRHLEKRVAHGEHLRKTIANEKYMMIRVEQSLALATANRDKEQHIKEKLSHLLSNYRVPLVSEYIMLCRRNESLKSLIKMWQKKVAVATLVKNNKYQKWRQLMKNRCVSA